MTPAQITEEQRDAAVEIAAEGIMDRMDMDAGAEEWAEGAVDALLSAGWGPTSAAEARGYARGVEEHSVGWLFCNPDTGDEFSVQHPIESGEVLDATDIEPATADNLLPFLLGAWEEMSATRFNLDELASACAMRDRAQSGLADIQKHRDAWRAYAYGKGPKPHDFLDSDMPGTGPTLIERAATIIQECRDELFASHQVAGVFTAMDAADEAARNDIREMDAWLRAALSPSPAQKED